MTEIDAPDPKVTLNVPKHLGKQQEDLDHQAEAVVGLDLKVDPEEAQDLLVGPRGTHH